MVTDLYSYLLLFVSKLSHAPTVCISMYSIHAIIVLYIPFVQMDFFVYQVYSVLQAVRYRFQSSTIHSQVVQTV